MIQLIVSKVKTCFAFQPGSTSWCAGFRSINKRLVSHRLCCIWLLCLSINGQADEIIIAVASNFNAAMKRLTPVFQEETGHKLLISFGSTGKLYAQISQGAPYQVFLAADNIRTRLAVKNGYAVAGTEVVYARGRLVLWSADEQLVDKAGLVLKTNQFRKLALANPKTAPYGTAAMVVLKSLGMADQLAAKLVQAENIGQAFQFVVTRNAQLGFIALSQIRASSPGGSVWLVPDNLYPAILQEAVLLKPGQGKAPARQFLQFLTGDSALAVLHQLGYGNSGYNRSGYNNPGYNSSDYDGLDHNSLDHNSLDHNNSTRQGDK